MMIIGIAVSTMTGPLPYAVTAASAGSVSPMEAAGAEEARPMTVSWATPIASGWSLAGGAGAAATTGAADRSLMYSSPVTVCQNAFTDRVPDG